MGATLLLLVLALILPSVIAWLSARAYPSVLVSGWKIVGMALLSGLVASVAIGSVLVGVWLPQFDGRCGGWLGETASCGFRQFAVEAVFFATMTLAVPVLLGTLGAFMLLVLITLRTRRQRKGQADTPAP